MKTKKVTLKQAIELCRESEAVLEIDFRRVKRRIDMEGEVTITVGYEGWRYYAVCKDDINGLGDLIYRTYEKANISDKI